MIFINKIDGKIYLVDERTSITPYYITLSSKCSTRAVFDHQYANYEFVGWI
jgi:hypothetical protein